MAFEAAMLPPEPEQMSSSPATPRREPVGATPARPTVDDIVPPVPGRPGVPGGQIYRPPTLYTDSSSIQVITSDLMGGSRVTAGPVNAPIETQGEQLSGAVGGDGLEGAVGRAKPSDRVCPVCNGDYSHVSMEDFQTHVFECFDEDNGGPETIKPEAGDRTCPMCTHVYPSSMPQHEFEAHVHSHFGEETLGGFTLLNRDRE